MENNKAYDFYMKIAGINMMSTNQRLWLSFSKRNYDAKKAILNKQYSLDPH